MSPSIEKNSKLSGLLLHAHAPLGEQSEHSELQHAGVVQPAPTFGMSRCMLRSARCPIELAMRSMQSSPAQPVAVPAMYTASWSGTHDHFLIFSAAR